MREDHGRNRWPRRLLLLTGWMAVSTVSLLLLRQGMGTAGIGLSADSLMYLSTALSLEDTGAYRWQFEVAGPTEEERSRDWIRAAYWPPGYPALLAAGKRLTGDVLASARHLAQVLLVLQLTLVLLHGLEGGGNALRALLAAAWYGTSYGVLACHGIAWSEQLFMVFLLGALLALRRSISLGRPGLLHLAGVLAAGCCLSRYIGVFLLAPLALGIWRGFPERSGSWRLRRLAAVAGWIGIPLGAWLTRNALVVGSLLGTRPPDPESSPWRPFLDLLRTIREAFLPAAAGQALLQGLVWTALVLLGAGLLLGGRAWRRTAQSGLLASAALAYGLLLYGSKLRVWIDPVDIRFVLPLFALALVGLAGLQAASPPKGWAGRAGTAGLLLMALASGLHAAGAELPPGRLFHLQESTIRGSSLIRAARRQGYDPPLLTNRPALANLHLQEPVLGFPVAPEWESFRAMLERRELRGHSVALFQGSLERPGMLSADTFLAWCEADPARVQRLYAGPEGVLLLLQPGFASGEVN